MLEDSIKLNSHVKLYSFDSKLVKNYQDYQKLQDKRKYLVDEGNNLVVNQGLNFIRDMMTAVTTGSVTHSQPGTSNTAVNATDTALGGAIGSRLAIQTRYSGGNGVINLDTFYTAGDNNGTWAEAAIFTASSGGSMIARRVLASTFVKSTSNTALLAWAITMTSS